MFKLPLGWLVGRGPQGHPQRVKPMAVQSAKSPRCPAQPPPEAPACHTEWVPQTMGAQGLGHPCGGAGLETQLSSISPMVVPLLSAHPQLSCRRQWGPGGPHQLGGTHQALGHAVCCSHSCTQEISFVSGQRKGGQGGRRGARHCVPGCLSASHCQVNNSRTEERN